MARGGKRIGSGRKPGTATRKTREIADKAAAEGVTPLEVMLRAMREHFAAERWDDAATVAKDAAPYIHPRLANIDMKAEHELVGYAIAGEPIDDPEEWEKQFGPAN